MSWSYFANAVLAIGGCCSILLLFRTVRNVQRLSEAKRLFQIQRALIYEGRTSSSELNDQEFAAVMAAHNAYIEELKR